VTTFLPEFSSRKKAKTPKRLPALPSLPLLSSRDALGLRCGDSGFAEGEKDGSCDAEENNMDERSSQLSSQISVDRSTSESEESLLANKDNKGNSANVGTSSITENNEDSEASDNEKDPGLTESIDETASSEEGSSALDEDEGKFIVEESENSDPDKVSQLLSSASKRRAEGKALHDSGNLKDATTAFRDAASLLDEAIPWLPSSGDDSGIVVERATCRLHEALCLFKDGRPGDCVKACTDVLEDGVSVVKSEVEKDNDNDGTGNNDAIISSAVIKVNPVPAAVATKLVIPSQIRARAHHRRAKARLALGDFDGALEDAQIAAFMGDRNAVQFYGRLLREGSNAAFGLSEESGDKRGMSSNSLSDGILGGLSGSTGSNSLVDLLGAGSSDFSSSLLSSFLSSGSNDDGVNSPLGLLGSFLSPPPETSKRKRRKKGKKKNGLDTLAKSVLTNLVKRLEDVETQELICNYLKSTDTQQIMEISKMAGVPLQLKSAQRLASLAAGVTPQGIGKSVVRVKRGVSIIKTVRKVLKVIDHYKAYIILAVLCCWIRSAMTQPYVIKAK